MQHRVHATRPLFEMLEPRRLLSASSVVQSDLVYVRELHGETSASSSSIQGYTPAQISHAYGFDTISFSNGTVKGNGAGADHCDRRRL